MEQYTQINRMYWSGSLFQWIFYASVLLILVFERRLMHKIIFGVFPLVMIVGVFNPVTASAVGFFFEHAELYHVRLFTVIPVFYCIAYGMTILLGKTSGGARLAGVCAAVALIVIAGRCVYLEPWMQVAENMQKVPGQVNEVLEALPRDKENPSVAFPDPLDIYVRQVDPDVIMPYGRQYSAQMEALHTELNQAVPDAGRVMSITRNNSVDYFVVNKSPEARSAFSEDGYEPVAETEAYYIYPVTGPVIYDQRLNEKRQLASETARDINGQPTNSWKSVITTRHYAYDRWGNCIRETYFDKDGKPVSTIEGFYGKQMHHRLHGLAWVVDSLIYLDADGQPMLSSGRYETRYDYSSQKDVVEERYFDREGRPMNLPDTGYAGIIRQFDSRNRIVAERYFDVNRQATTTVYGYAKLTRDYDEAGRIVSEKYFDTQGAAIDNWAGFAEWARTYDEKGRVIDESFINAAGQKVDIKGRLKQIGSFDLLQWAKKEDIPNSVGVGYTWNEDGSCTVAGTAQGLSWYDLLMDNKPFYFMNGETYDVRFSGDNVFLVVDFYRDSTWSSQIDGQLITGDARFTVPQDCGAMVIRLQVQQITSVNERVYPRIYVIPDGT